MTTETTITLTGRDGKTHNVPGVRIHEHWAIAQKIRFGGRPQTEKSRDWALTHIPSALIAGEWRKDEALALIPHIPTPPSAPDLTIDADVISWVKSVLAIQDRLMAEKVKGLGLTLFRVTVTKEIQCEGYVLAKDQHAAERMAERDDAWDFDDVRAEVNASAWELKADRPLHWTEREQTVIVPSGLPEQRLEDLVEALGLGVTFTKSPYEKKKREAVAL